MKKLALLLLSLITMGGVATAADVAINGNLSTWSGFKVDYDANSDASDSVGLLYVQGELFTTVELTSNIKVVIELELNDAVSSGNTVNKAENTVELNEAYVHIGEFFHDSISLTIGHQYMEYSLRNNGNAIWLADEFTAFKGSFKFEKGQLDAFYAKHVESLASNIADSDVDVLGLALTYDFTENIHTLFQLSYNKQQIPGLNNNGSLFFVAGGIDLFLLDKKLELFLEAAFQAGEVGNTDISSFAIDAGARWNFGEVGSLSNLFAELSVAYRQGQDNSSDITAWNTGFSRTSYGLIAENNSDATDNSPLLAGFARSEVLAIRLLVGTDFTEKIGSSLLLAFYDNTADNADAYGFEVNVKTTYKYSENLSMTGLLGVFIPDDTGATGGGDDPIFGAAFVTDVSF